MSVLVHQICIAKLSCQRTLRPFVLFPALAGPLVDHIMNRCVDQLHYGKQTALIPLTRSQNIKWDIMSAFVCYFVRNNMLPGTDPSISPTNHDM